MSKEIRRVPKNWSHPRDDAGNYLPLYDVDYDSALLRWVEAVARWESGEDPERLEAQKEGIRYYWHWQTPPSAEESYRLPHEESPDFFQVYETVSEGTPISPVFETADETIRWLVANGEDEETAKRFLQHGGLAEPIQMTPQGPQILKIVYNKPPHAPNNRDA